MERSVAVADQALRILKLSQEIVDVYRDHLENDSLTGVVADFSDEFVYLSLISENGTANGIAVVYRSDINRLRWGGNARQAIAQLVDAAGTKPTKPTISLESLESVLRDVSKTFGYVNVLTERVDNSETYIGEISELDSDTLILDTYGTFISRDRSKLLLNCADITRIDADAPYERSVRFLAKKES